MFNGKSILITGATGSFGQCCVETLLRDHAPRRVVVFSRDELKQSQMAEAIKNPAVRFFLGDIRDEGRLRSSFEGVDYVIHAAALKQVPAMEYNPGEAVKTNVLGSNNVVNVALDSGVKKVIALSTDKAALPINIYGATKFVADKLFISGNSIRGARETEFSVVRYGNVANSRGSVIPLFRKLKDSGATEIPITDPRMTRFLLTVQQGVNFVLDAFKRMKGGEVFVPKLPSVRIMDLARAIAPDASIRVIGIRPGEKLHEVLCPQEESRNTIEFDQFYVIKPHYIFSHAPDYSTTNLGEVGRPVAEAFEYRSDSNNWFLSHQELMDLLSEIE